MSIKKFRINRTLNNGRKMKMSVKIEKFDTVIKCKYLLSMQEGKAEVKENQLIAINNGYVHSVFSESKTLPPAEEIISLDHHLVCPGLINTHTHLPMVLFRGLGDHLTLQDWLHKVIFPLEKKLISPEFIRIGTELALLELIKNGITTVCDMYFHTPVMAELLDSYGLRGVLAVDMLSSFSDWKQDLDILCDKYKKHKRITPAIACHAPYTCSPEVLKLSARESKNRNLPISIHVAETKWEVDFIKKQYGKSPVFHLQDCDVIGPSCVFVHGVHLNEEELDLMAKTGTPLSYNPESNMKLGSGVAPILKALEKGISVGLGTDGAASNNNLNLFAEMDVGAKLQKLKNPDKTIEPAGMFSMVTAMAADVLGLGDQIGKIQEGFCADIIGLNIHQPHFYPRHDLLNLLVYSANGAEVDFMMCHGKTLMKDSTIIGFDAKRIYSEVEKLRSTF